MRVEELRQKFSPEQVNKYIKKRVIYQGYAQAEKIQREIDWFKTEKLLATQEPTLMVTYGMRSGGIATDLPEEEKWKLFEEKNNQPISATSLDEDEIRRVIKSYARLIVLGRLGFTFGNNEPSRLEADWKKDDAGPTSFQFALSPTERNIFLVRTIIPRGISSTITENLVSAPNEEKLRAFWRSAPQEILA